MKTRLITSYIFNQDLMKPKILELLVLKIS